LLAYSTHQGLYTDMARTCDLIYNHQQLWASRYRIKIDKDGYTLSLNDNLFLPLSLDAKEEFVVGSGKELGNDRNRGKMQALHSSSALMVNVFQYWRVHGVDAIAKACGAPKGMREMKFEQTHPTPVGSIPHLDVEFYGPMLKPMAVESKFTETYRLHTRRTIKDKYLDNTSIWIKLPRSQKLVELIRGEENGKTSFTYLDAPQLLKHILGLTTEFGTKGFELLYLWYEVPSLEADKHRMEVGKFKKQIGSEVNFRDMTYQELFEAIKKIPDVDANYTSYLAERYFPPCLHIVH